MNICQSILKSFKTLRTLTVRISGQTSLTHLRHSGHWSSGIGHTGNPLGIDHTGNRSDHEHSDHQSRSVRSDAIEHGSNRTRHRSDFLILHGEIVTHIVKLFPSDTLTQVNTLHLRWSDIIALGAVPALTTLSLRDVIVVPPLVREGRRSHIKKRKHSSDSSSSFRHSFSSSFREWERKRLKSKKKKKKHSKSRSSKRDKREKKHKRKRSPSPSPSSSSSSVFSDSSSFLQRSPARKKSRVNSRSPSPADDNPHSASRTVNPALHRDLPVYLWIMMTIFFCILRIIRT